MPLGVAMLFGWVGGTGCIPRKLAPVPGNEDCACKGGDDNDTMLCPADGALMGDVGEEGQTICCGAVRAVCDGAGDLDAWRDCTCAWANGSCGNAGDLDAGRGCDAGCRGSWNWRANVPNRSCGCVKKEAAAMSSSSPLGCMIDSPRRLEGPGGD